MRGQPLVHEFRADTKAAVQALREPAGEFAHQVLGAVGVRGEADHQQYRPPLGDKLPDRGKPRAVCHGGDGDQRVGNTGLEVADCDADALRAEVERQNGARPRGVLSAEC